MTACEDQAEALVGNGRLLVHLVVRRRALEPRQQLGLPLQGPLAAEPVDRPVARGGHEPGSGICRDAVPRPALERDRNRLLKGVLGEVEVAEDADQGREDASVLLAKELLERRYALTWASRITIGRTSTWPKRADGIFAAHSIASSSDSVSTR